MSVRVSEDSVTLPNSHLPLVYLGKQYLLKVLEDPNVMPQVKLLRGKLEVTLRQKSAVKVQQLVNDWYKVRAKEVFAKRLEAMLEQTLWVVERLPLRILTMQTQWGSCSPQGRLTLNPHLVKAPRECIDYVILHELCHLAEHNHSERFYLIKARLDARAGGYVLA
ncbi:MAG: YgjP-like metallopeptidase domain-containing protein [Thiothrix litoralis]|uniref:M48 family metallopeptidase n=1 Tax=Thiothrix litoralis TaxID=2891210 RepID=UPI003C78173A